MESCGEENYSFYVNYICISDNEAIWTSAAIGLVVISIIISVNFIMKIAKKVNKLILSFVGTSAIPARNCPRVIAATNCFFSAVYSIETDKHKNFFTMVVVLKQN